MENDRELLEYAAKAAGYKMTPERFVGDYWIKDGCAVWNPLTDDGDALRLMVKLKINVEYSPETYTNSDCGGSVTATYISFRHKNDVCITKFFLDKYIKRPMREDEIKFSKYMQNKNEVGENAWHESNEEATRRAIVRAAAEIGKQMNGT